MGDPVPGTGQRRFHRRRSKGVSANSRIIPHQYPDEGDKGPRFRRLVRQREKRLWWSEIDD